MAFLVVPLTSAGLIPYLNNTMPEQVLDKLDDSIPNSSNGAPIGHATPVAATVMVAPKAVGNVQETVVMQLKSLGELRDAGVLSSEEFDAKKSELLARI